MYNIIIHNYLSTKKNKIKMSFLNITLLFLFLLRENIIKTFYKYDHYCIS